MSPPASIPQEPEDPRARQLTIRVAAMPADANAYGDIFGGWLMSQIDIAGSVVAIHVARGRVATISVNEMIFLQPVHIGDLVSFYAQLQQVGNTSVSVDVEAFAERDEDRNRLHPVATARLTYVAVDGRRKPRQVPYDKDKFPLGQ